MASARFPRTTSFPVRCSRHGSDFEGDDRLGGHVLSKVDACRPGRLWPGGVQGAQPDPTVIERRQPSGQRFGGSVEDQRHPVAVSGIGRRLGGFPQQQNEARQARVLPVDGVTPQTEPFDIRRSVLGPFASVQKPALPQAGMRSAQRDQALREAEQGTCRPAPSRSSRSRCPDTRHCCCPAGCRQSRPRRAASACPAPGRRWRAGCAAAGPGADGSPVSRSRPPRRSCRSSSPGGRRGYPLRWLRCVSPRRRWRRPGEKPSWQAMKLTEDQLLRPSWSKVPADPSSRSAISWAPCASPRQKRRTPSRKASFHSAKPGGNSPRR